VVVSPQPADGIRWGDVHYPAAITHKPAWSDEAVSVYSGRAVIRVDATADPAAPPGDVPLHLKLDYQGCSEDTCFPPTSRDLEVTIHLSPKGAATQEPIHFEGQSDLEALLQKSPSSISWRSCGRAAAGPNAMRLSARAGHDEHLHPAERPPRPEDIPAGGAVRAGPGPPHLRRWAWWRR